MVNGRAGRKDDCTVIWYNDALLSELFSRQGLNLDEGAKVNIHAISFRDVEIR